MKQKQLGFTEREPHSSESKSTKELFWTFVVVDTQPQKNTVNIGNRLVFYSAIEL